MMIGNTKLESSSSAVYWIISRLLFMLADSGDAVL